MSKVVRRLLAMGQLHSLEYALLEDGTTSAAGNAITALKAGLMDPDPDREEGDPWPDERQPGDYAKLMAIIMKFVNDGVPAYGGAVNDLDDGIWEFKVGSKRFSFFDTDGAGSYISKLRYTDAAGSPYPDDTYWWFPDFDRSVRLGFAFVKTGATAGKHNIDETLRVRREDLGHDGPESIAQSS